MINEIKVKREIDLRHHIEKVVGGVLPLFENEVGVRR